MLQAMKHRGPDSTGYALYRPESEGYVMHVKLAEANGHQDFDLRRAAQPPARGHRGPHEARRAPAISSIDSTTSTTTR